MLGGLFQRATLRGTHRWRRHFGMRREVETILHLKAFGMEGKLVERTRRPGSISKFKLGGLLYEIEV